MKVLFVVVLSLSIAFALGAAVPLKRGVRDTAKNDMRRKFFVFIESLSAGSQEMDDLDVAGESHTCDQLGCNLFCKKNHFDKGICHSKGCECLFH